MLNQAERLDAFRAAFPEKTMRVRGAEWHYRTGGAGERTMLLLPGGELVNDMGFDLAQWLSGQFRVIYPAYPRAGSLDELADGVAEIVAAEDAGRVWVLGASFGGAVAQNLVRRHPRRVERLILSNTGVPIARLARGRKIANAVLGGTPWVLLRPLMSRSILKLLNPPADEAAFWREYTRQLFAERLGKADVLANLWIQYGYHLRYRFSPRDLADWPGQIFVIESDNDIFNAERRKALRDTYPQAPVFTFHGAGHAPAFSRAAEYREVLERFFQ